MSKTVDHLVPIASARADAMQAHEDQDAPDVIAGIFSLYDIKMYALIDPGPMHSYICIEHVSDRMPSVEQLLYNMLVLWNIVLESTEHIKLSHVGSR